MVSSLLHEKPGSPASLPTNRESPSFMVISKAMGKLRVLLIGCGDVALRTARLLTPTFRLYGLTRNPDQYSSLRAAGITPIAGDLDVHRTLGRLAVDPFAVLHFAPPPSSGDDDPRTRNLLAALATPSRNRSTPGRARSLPRVIVYISTTGVYGDSAGALIDETHPLAPATTRAARRVAAERRLRRACRRTFQEPEKLAILRAPGIYAEDRLPIERLQRGMPALIDRDDVYTNHIHADDLARATIAAMFRAKPQRAYNVTDDAHWKMGEYFDRVADALALNRPPRIPRDEADRVIPPMMRSFMSESRRLSNARICSELRWRPLHSTPQAMLDRMREARALAATATAARRNAS